MMALQIPTEVYSQRDSKEILIDVKRTESVHVMNRWQ